MNTNLDDPPSQNILDFILTDSFILMMGVIVLVALIFLSAVISASEVAFFTLTSEDITKSRQTDTNQDKWVIELIEKPRLLLATILVANNFVNVAFITLSTILFWKIKGANSMLGMDLVFLSATVTMIILFFGEIIPKIYASSHNRAVALFASKAIKVFKLLFKPLIFLMLQSSNLIEKRFEKRKYNVTVNELHEALEITTTNEKTSDEEKDILRGIVNFGTLIVKQIMRSRVDIIAFEGNIGFSELMKNVQESNYSRVPIYSETIDTIKGILYIKDLLPHLNREDSFDWVKLVRPSYFVPETKKIESLLKDFQEKRVHMAIVVDEYGGTSGIITLEDIIEEIVGEINDEFDDEEIKYEIIDESTYLFEGKITLNDFCKIIKLSPAIFEEVKGESESLGGLLLELNVTLPNKGDKIGYDRFEFVIMDVDSKKINTIKVIINPIDENNDAKQ